VLADRGLSFNDLAAAIEPQLNVAPSDWQPETGAELVRWLAERADRLQAHGVDFVAKMRRRLALGGEPTRRQADWLRGIYSRLGGEE
jgi:hypothetical protein